MNNYIENNNVTITSNQEGQFDLCSHNVYSCEQTGKRTDVRLAQSLLYTKSPRR